MRAEQRIGIERNYDFAASVAQASVQCRRLTRIRNRDELDARVPAEIFRYDFARVVLRPIIDNDDLVTRIIGTEQTANCILDDELFVVSRYQNRHERHVVAARVDSFSAS